MAAGKGYARDRSAERVDTANFLRYRLKQLLELRDKQRERGEDVDRDFLESVIKLCREIGLSDE